VVLLTIRSKKASHTYTITTQPFGRELSQVMYWTQESQGTTRHRHYWILLAGLQTSKRQRFPWLAE